MSYSVNQLSQSIGAEVVGIDLSDPTSETVATALNGSFVDHKILAFRDQRLTADQMLEASRIFGSRYAHRELRSGGFHNVPENQLVQYITNEDRRPDGTHVVPGENFHIDNIVMPYPPKAIILYAVKLPSVGGDTSFVDLQRAFEDLPEEVKSMLDGRLAIYRLGPRVQVQRGNEEPCEWPMLPGAQLHPIVRTHPESGRKALFINPSNLVGIYGMTENEEIELLDYVVGHCFQPQYEYRYKWRIGDLTIWDNRTLMHKANPYYDMNEIRKLYRIMLEGDAPV